jgi:tetratricopeptide (TPR) repeat protein
MAILVGALKLAESLDDVRVQLRAINNMGDYLEDDDPSLALEYNRRGVALARRLGNAETEALFAAGLAWNTFFAGRPRESLAMLEQIDVNDIGPYARGQIDTGRELLLVLLGDREVASAVRRSIDVDYQSISHHEFRAWHIGNRANLELHDGRINEAMVLADQFLATNVDAYYGNLMVARCAFRLGDRSRARAAVDAVDAAPRKGRAVEARRLALRAALEAMEGDQRAALESFGEAFRTFRDLGLLFDLACHQLDMAAVFAGTPQGTTIAAEARAAFETMGAHGLAGQIDALTARPASRASASCSAVPASALAGWPWNSHCVGSSE